MKVREAANHQSPEHHLSAQVDTCLQIFDRKRRLNKFLAFGLKISIASLGASTTVLLGISYSGKPDNLFKNIAIGLSALSGVIAAWDAFFNHRVLWLRYTVAANKMRDLREQIRYRVSRDKGLTEEIADKFFTQYQTIVAEINNAWEDLRKTEPDKSDLSTAKNHS